MPTKTTTILILTAPFEEEYTGDVDCAHMIEDVVNSIPGFRARYLKTDQVYPGTGRSSALDKEKILTFKYPLQDVFETTKAMGVAFLEHINCHYDPENTIIFIHSRFPHTGSAFDACIVQSFKNTGFKVIALMHEYAFNFDDIARASRNLHFLQLASLNLLDAIFIPSRSESRNFLRDLERGYVSPLRDGESVETYSEVLKIGQSSRSTLSGSKLMECIQAKTVMQPLCSVFLRKSDSGFEYCIQDLESRPNNIINLSMIRKNKGIEECIELAKKLYGKTQVEINICGKVAARDYSFFLTLLAFMYGQEAANLVQQELDKFTQQLTANADLTDDARDSFFNSFVQSTLEDISKKFKLHYPNLRLHVGLKQDEILEIAKRCKFVLRLDDKGMSDNASGYINLMQAGCIPIATENTRIIQNDHQKVIISLGDAIAFKENKSITERVNIIDTVLHQAIEDTLVLKEKQMKLIKIMQGVHSYAAFRRSIYQLLTIALSKDENSENIITTAPQQKKARHLMIAPTVWRRYNKPHVLRLEFKVDGIYAVKKKYHHENRILPVFLHNLFAGMSSPESDLFLQSNLCAWSDDRSLLFIPRDNHMEACFRFKEAPIEIKNLPEGFGLICWVIDSRTLDRYGWKPEKGRNPNKSFKEWLSVSTSHRQPGNCTTVEEKIAALEEKEGGPAYLTTILDLTESHLTLLKSIKKTSIEFIEDKFGFDPEKDVVDILFHFPTAEANSILHAQIRINQRIHPAEENRAFRLDEIVRVLEAGESVVDLVLRRTPYYCHIREIDICKNIRGAGLRKTPNPFLLPVEENPLLQKPLAATDVRKCDFDLLWYTTALAEKSMTNSALLVGKNIVCLGQQGVTVTNEYPVVNALQHGTKIGSRLYLSYEPSEVELGIFCLQENRITCIFVPSTLDNYLKCYTVQDGKLSATMHRNPGYFEKSLHTMERETPGLSDARVKPITRITIPDETVSLLQTGLDARESLIDDKSERKIDEDYMCIVFELVARGWNLRDGKFFKGDWPHGNNIAAIMVDQSNKIIGWGVNYSTVNYLFHAETLMIQNFLRKNNTPCLPEGVKIYTSLQCCSMCAGYIAHYGKNITVIYGQRDRIFDGKTALSEGINNCTEKRSTLPISDSLEEEASSCGDILSFLFQKETLPMFRRAFQGAQLSKELNHARHHGAFFKQTLIEPDVLPSKILQEGEEFLKAIVMNR